MSKVIVYGEWCWICDHWRREFSFGTRYEAAGSQSFLWQKFYYSEKGIGKPSDIDIRKGQRVFHPPVLSRPYILFQFSSVQFSYSVVSDSLRPHELQHSRPPCPSPTHGVYPNPCPSSQWCHPAISSSVIPFSSCPQSLPALGSFPVSQLFAWGGQSVGVSASTSVPPMNTQDWSPLGLTGWISLQSKGLSRVFSNTTVQKHQCFGAQLSSQSNSHIHTGLLEKP